MNRDVAILVEGVGVPLTARAAGALDDGFLFTISGQSALSVESFPAPDDAAVTNPPATSSQSSEWFGGDTKASGLSFSVAASPLAIRTLIDYDVEPLTFLSSAITDTATTIYVDSSSAFAVGTLLWFVDECVRVTGNPLQGVLEVVRGACHTRPAAAIAGANVYPENPYVIDRRMSVYVVDVFGETKRIWQGFVGDSDLALGKNQIMVKGVHTIAQLKKANIGRAPVPLPYFGTVQRIGQELPYVSATTRTKPVGVRKENAAAVRWLHDPETNLVVRALDNLDVLDKGGWLGSPQLNLDTTTGSTVVFDANLFEALVIDAENLAESSTAALDYPAHPLGLALALMVSDSSPDEDPANYNVFSTNWGLGLTSDSLDITSIIALIEETRHLAITQIIVGGESDEVGLIELIKTKLLVPFNLTFAQASDGRLTIVKERLAFIDNFAAAVEIEPLPRTIDFKWKPNSRIEALQIEVGGAPWVDADTLTIDADLGGRRDSLRKIIFSDRNSVRIDFSSVATSALSAYPQQLGINRLAPAKRGQPTVTLTSVFTVPPAVGNQYAIVDLEPEPYGFAYPLPGGEEAKLSTSIVEAFGQVYSVKETIRRGVFTISMRIANWHAGRMSGRLAPSAEVVAVDPGAGTVTLAPNIFTFAGEANDGSHFMVGDGVYFRDDNGARSTPALNWWTITTIFDVTGSQTLVEIAGEDVSTVNVGDYMELAPWLTVPPQASRLVGFDTPYVYFANSTNTIGGTPTLDGFVYGV